MFQRSPLVSRRVSSRRTVSIRPRSLGVLAAAAALTLSACGGPTVGAQESEIPDQLALDDETTTSRESTTTVAEPTTSAEESEDPAETSDPTPAETTAPVTEPESSDPAPTETSAPEAPPEPPATEAPAATTQPATTAAVATDADDRSFQLLNELRESLGLAPLVRDATMDEFARGWSAQMGTTGNFEHSDAPYGENIAFASDTSQSGVWAAETFNTNWIDSPGHYANMTNANYTTIGVGIVLTDNGWYGTHVFK